MKTKSDPGRVRLSIDLDPDLRRQIKIMAAAKDLSIRDYVMQILWSALRTDESIVANQADSSWSRLSARSFARDWESEDDRVYDELPAG